MNQKTKTALVAGTVGYLIVNQIVLICENIKLERDLRATKRTGRYLSNVAVSLVDRLPVEEMPNVLNDLQFFLITAPE